MLAADKRLLESTLQQSSLVIQEKELRFYTDNFNAVSTQAALLAGFCYTGLTLDFLDDTVHPFAAFMFYLCTTLAMGFELVCVCNSTICTMYGPGLALRGPDGSMKKAVDGLAVERQRVMRYFAVGLVWFHFAALFFGWMYFDAVNAIIVTLVMLGSLGIILKYGARIVERFRIPREKVVTGMVDLTTAQSAEVTDRAVGWTCPRCDAAVRHGARFCTECGGAKP